MKQGTENHFFLQLSKVFALAILITGCAKDLPDDISEDISNNVHSINLFDQKVVVKANSKNTTLAIKANNEVAGFYALNQKGLRSVSIVSGDQKLAPFFKGLQIETSSDSEEFKVSFKLTDSFLVAYIQAKGNQSDHYNAIRSGQKTPIFQYPITDYGIMAKDINALGEETRTVIFKSRNRSQSTHLQIDPLLQNRVAAGLHETKDDLKNTIFRKKAIHGKVVTFGGLKNLFKNNSAAVAKSTFIKSDQSPLKLKVLEEKIYATRAVKLSQMSILEKAALLDSNDKRVSKCDKEIAKLTKIKLSNCALVPVFSLSIDHVQLKLNTDNGTSIATVTNDIKIHHSKSQFIKLDIEESLYKDLIGQEVNKDFANKVLISKKDQIDLNGTYLYVPMTLGTPREVRIADPFFQGNEKVVKLQWAKDGLEVLELDKENRWNDNPLNNLPVLKIVGDHKEFKCKTDNNGECTSGDEEVKDLSWTEKRFFMPQFEKLKVNEVNTLNLFTLNSSCLKTGDTQLMNYTMEKGVIHIELERSYTTIKDFEKCLWKQHYIQDTESYTGFSNASFKTRFSFSLVKLDKLITKDYKPVDYPIHDHNQYGFFKNKSMVLKLDNDSQRKEKKYLLNRWAPGTEKSPRFVNYYLSDSFFKPENANILKATKKSEKVMNDALRQANSGLRLKFDYQTRGKSSGDLRNNVVVLIDDPLANGLLGYAPTVTNPYTGEIVQGHINMYGGVLTSTSRRVWQSMVDLTKEKAQVSFLSNAKKGLGQINQEDQTEQNEKGISDTVLADIQSQLEKKEKRIAKFKKEIKKSGFLSQKSLSKIQKNQNRALESVKRDLKKNVNPSHLNMKDLNQLEKLSLKKEQKIHRFSTNNAYSEEFLQIAGKVKSLLPGVQNEKDFFVEGTEVLKSWSDLSEKLKQKAIDIIVPYAYTSTLVHEFGHALGLRHNFIGSFDKDNFYSKKEMDELGERVGSSFENAPVYSSVMDYANSTLNELTIFGKYDIAALRFAYAREVEVTTKKEVKEGEEEGKIEEISEFVKIPTTLQALYPTLSGQNQEKKDYSFCTDGNAGLSTSCSRFDEGTTLVEITEHRIAQYKRLYQYRNLRDGRNNFSTANLSSYLTSRSREFSFIRDVFEDWERFTVFFEDDVMISGCTAEQVKLYPVCKMINDRRDAVKIAANFFIEVLSTPDHLCALASSEAPEGEEKKTVQLKPLADTLEGLSSINYVPLSCFDPEVKKEFLKEKFIVVGEAGKFLNGFKDNHPDYIYSSDRYALGVWPDKLMAAKSLFQRETERPITDEVKRSFMDHRELQPKIFSIISHLASGTPLASPVKFKRENGEDYDEPYEIGLDYQVKKIPDYAWFRPLLGLPIDGAEYLNKATLIMAKSFGQTQDVTYRDQARKVINTFSVRKRDLGNSSNSPYILSRMIDDVIYGATEDNLIAFTMIESLTNAEFLNKVGREIVFKVLQWRINPAPPADLPPVELSAWGLDQGLITQLINLPEDDPKLNEKWFTDILGEELGKTSYLVYKLGKEKMEDLVAQKEAAKLTPPEVATADEKELYKISITSMASFIGGELSEEKLNKYKTYLEILPRNINKN